MAVTSKAAKKKPATAKARAKAAAPKGGAQKPAAKVAARQQVGEAKPPLLPEALTLFLKNTAWRAMGLVLFGGVVAVAAALYSYNPNDPAPNAASSLEPTNLLGLPGAYIADPLMQILGLGAWFLLLPPLVWAVKIMRLKWLPRFWANLALLPVGVALVALALSVYPPAGDFAVQAGYGGALGQVLYRQFVELMGGLNIPAWANLLGFIVVAVPVYAFSLALKGEEWRTLGRAVWAVCLWMLRTLWRALVGFVSLFRRSRKTVRREPVFGPADTRTAASDEDDYDDYDDGDDTPPFEVDAAPAPRAAGAGILSGFSAGRSKENKASLVREKSHTTKGKREDKERQPSLPIVLDGDYHLPTLDLLTDPPPATQIDEVTAEALEQNAAMLLGVLEDFGVNGEILDVKPGPVVTLYELEPARGTKSSRIISLADDIARSMSAVSARVAVVPGRNAIGIELPNVRRDTVYLREILASKDYEQSHARLGIALGKDIGGMPVVVDLASMPHLLVAGTTGSGKSVGINTMILSLIYKHSPETLRLIMVDPKMLELSIYDGIPHLLTPVVTEPQKAVVALKWAVREMEERYAKMSFLKVRSIAAFNKRVKEARASGEVLKRVVQTGYDPETGDPLMEEQVLDFEPLPFIVIVIDEMADLMIVAGKEVEALVQRLAQMARAAGLHVIMATQRPSVDVITGTIKANFPTRISFQVTSKIDSRTILNEQGAEQLLGQGDMLYSGSGRVRRVHGAFVGDGEVEAVVDHLRRQGEPSYVSAVVQEPDGGFDSPFIPGPSGGGDNGSSDELYDKAVAVVLRDRRASTSYIQRQLSIGYNKAANLIEEMERQGVISSPNHKNQREILVPNREDEF